MTESVLSKLSKRRRSPMAQFRSKPFGVTKNGEKVNEYIMSNPGGLAVSVLNYGCVIKNIFVPTKQGPVDVVVGHDTFADYENDFNSPSSTCCGAFVGRYANRIENAEFSIGGQKYQLEANSGKNHLHGTFPKKLYDVKAFGDTLLMETESPDGEDEAGKKTPHIGRFWSGCAGAVKHGLEIMGIGLLDVANNKCMMLRAHQTIGNSALKMRNKTLVEYYISVMKRYSKKMLSITDIVVADAFFSTSTFEKGISELGFYLVSRFRDNACLHYIPKKEKRRGRPRVKGDKIDLANLNFSCMEELHIDGLDGKAYTLEAYAKALKKRVRLVIWRMPGGKCKLFFSTKLSMTGEEVLKTYRTRFQIEFCYRDSKQFTGLMDCQARHKRQLDFAFNASFASLNAAKVFMKDNGMDNSMAKVKSLMFNANYTKLIFDMSRCRPNRTLISKIVKELIGWQPKAA